MSAGDRDRELCFMPISELGERYRTHQLSPVEVTEAMLRRIERHNETIRAYITVTSELALDQARHAEREIVAGRYRGPLHGITVSLKDNIATKGIRTSCASTVNPDWLPDYDASVYAKLQEAGAILVGKANLFEYAFSMNPAFPQPLNPWNPERTTSGSSSGSAVGVAAGMAHGSIGTDTGGSGRAPANANGVVGLKATFGRVSCWGIFPLSYSLDHATMMSRTVKDSSIMLQATAGYDQQDESSSTAPVPDFSSKLGGDLRGVTVGYPRGYTHEGIDDEVDTVIGTAMDVLRSLGATVVDIKLPFVRRCVALQIAIMNAEAATIHWRNHRESASELGESALMRLDLGALVPATAYIQAQRVRKVMRDEFRKLLQEVDVIAGPALAIQPGKADTWTTLINGKEIDLRDAGPEYTGIFNLTGMPAIVLPAGFSSAGTPIGIQIAGRWFDEQTVLKVADAYEQATEWHRSKPPLPDQTLSLR